ncbi:MAG: hypothetical protein IPK19_33965 [Chloroflexi bacterium]|nr:hypothetical protein [Chloroflexota bacterium]
MQISRHWRMKAKRYRLEGVRYETGEMRLQARAVTATSEQPIALQLQTQAMRIPVKA